MKTLEECVVTAMDGSDKELYPFLPYMLQDIWEIGVNPEAIIKLIRMHSTDYSNLKVLDLGCGKGAVSVKVSKEFGCTCNGIDAIPEFIDSARQIAKEYNVGRLCNFEIGDIREKIKELVGYDIIILGAIGPVFGNYYTTLTTLSKCLNKKGFFIIDDGYIDDNSSFTHPLMFKKNILLQQIDRAGMVLAENDIVESEDIKDSDDYIFENLKKRCYELIQQNPDKKILFLEYIKNQEFENDVLENKIISTTMLIKRKEDF